MQRVGVGAWSWLDFWEVLEKTWEDVWRRLLWWGMGCGRPVVLCCLKENNSAIASIVEGMLGIWEKRTGTMTGGGKRGGGEKMRREV